LTFNESTFHYLHDLIIINIIEDGNKIMPAHPNWKEDERASVKGGEGRQARGPTSLLGETTKGLFKF